MTGAAMTTAERFAAEEQAGAAETGATVGLRARWVAAWAEHAATHRTSAARHGCGFCWEQAEALNATGPLDSIESED